MKYACNWRLGGPAFGDQRGAGFAHGSANSSNGGRPEPRSWAAPAAEAASRKAASSNASTNASVRVRAGKYLPVTATEALIRWKPPERKLLDERSRPGANHLRFRIGTDPAIALGANVKTNGAAMIGAPTELVLCRPEANAMKAYERLLGDAIDGDPTLFARKNEVEEAWRVVEPALGNVIPVHLYETGSWGPREAERLSPVGGWHNPAKRSGRRGGDLAGSRPPRLRTR